MSRGGHPATSMAASMAASMLPPSANPRMVELQEKKRQEAERRRRNEEEKKQSEKAKEDFWKSSLFEEPTKVASGENTVGCKSMDILLSHLNTYLNSYEYEAIYKLSKIT